METVFIKSDYITLGQFLKYIGLIGNGGEAKIAVLSHKILINNELESRRGRKIYPRDQVKIDKMTYLVLSNHENK